MQFNSKILILPGLGNSGAEHWQSLWESKHNFLRVNQLDWETPHCEDWIKTIDQAIQAQGTSEVILVGHSLACATICFWAKKYARPIKGALLVAPSDTEADSYPEGTSGFTPIPLEKLPFPSIVIASTNDFYVTFARAEYFAQMWGSKLVNIGEAGHINVSSGFGEWEEGLQYLKELDLGV